MMISRLKDERGVAMIVAIGVIAVTLAIVATVAVAALQLSFSTNQTVENNQALQVAQTGLQVATYRLNFLQPSSSQCVTNVVASPSGNYCAGYTQSVGNNGSFTYYTSPVMSGSQTCAGLTIVNSNTVTQRCIVSIGTVNGVSRRLQVRVSAFGGGSLFPINGILSLTGATVSNSATINGVLGTNGQITMSGAAVVNSAQLGPSAPAPSLKGSAKIGSTSYNTVAQGPFVLSPVQTGNTATVNDNQRIVNGLSNPTVSPYDTSSGNVTYNASTRALSIANGGSLTLTGSTYNFCSLSLAGAATITIPASDSVRIFIDSPDDPTSGCPAGSGGFTMSNGTVFNGPPGVATALQFYIYGLNNDSQVINLDGNAQLYASIYAPQSTIDISNSGGLTGAIASYGLIMTGNPSFTWYSGDSSLTSSVTELGYTTAWHECGPLPSGSTDPSTGC